MQIDLDARVDSVEESVELLQLLWSVIPNADDVFDVAEKQLWLQWAHKSFPPTLGQVDGGERFAVGAAHHRSLELQEASVTKNKDVADE